MLRRLLIVIGLAGLAWVTAITACSSSQRRDQNYGSDLGSDYSPEAGVFGDTDDALNDDANDDANDAAEPADATYSPDRPQSTESDPDADATH